MKTIRDTWLLFERSARETVRNPIWIIITLAQPLYFLILFAPLLKSVAKSPGYPSGGALNVFTPGLLVQLGLYGTVFVGFGLIGELRAGLIERLRVTPVSRLALLLGRALRDVAILEIQAILLILLAWPFGLDLDPVGVLVTLALLLLIGIVGTSCSYAISLWLRTEDALAGLLNAVTLPLMLLSGILLPLSLAPSWLRHVASVNPLTYAVDACRDLFNGRLSDPDILQAVLIFAALTALSLWWAVRSFRTAVA